MDEDQEEAARRLRLELARTRTQRLAGPHEHTYAVTAGGLVSIRYCVTCGKSWILKPAQHHFQHVSKWEPIIEE